MILDLGPIPAFAARAYADELGVFFDLAGEREHSRHRDEGAHPRGGAEAPARRRAPSSMRPSERGLVCQPVQVALAVAGLLTLSALACGSRPAVPPVADPPSASRGAVVIAQLDALAARAEALEERRGLAAWCEPGCPAGVAEVKVKADGIACRCIRPNVGVARVPQPSVKAARFQTSDWPSQHDVAVGESGAGGMDTAGVGLAFVGGAR